MKTRKNHRKGMVVVISAPSGTGKGTIIKEVEKRYEPFRFSVSVTTRQPRKGEVDGREYFFVTKEEFLEMVKKEELIEWVEYCDNFYGTPKWYLDKCCESGYDVFLDVEVQGAVNIKKAYPESVHIFVLPPSIKELENRIRGRGTETDEVIKKRIDKALSEIPYMKHYDYVFVNETVEEAYLNVLHILEAEHLALNRNENILDDIYYEGVNLL